MRDTPLDGWYPPDAGPSPVQAPVVHQAQVVLQAAVDGDGKEVLRVIEVLTGRGWPVLLTAAAAWCDRFAEHVRGDGTQAPLLLEIEDQTSRPTIQWAVELVCARAAWDHSTWAALVAEMPRESSLYVEVVLEWVAHYLRHGEVDVPRSAVPVLLEPVERRLPHAWRACRLRARPSSEIDHDEVMLFQAAIDTVWSQLSDTDRRRIHGYVCYERRDRASRRVMEVFERRLATVATSHASSWHMTRPAGDAVKINLDPDQWAADPPGARLRMIAAATAYPHPEPGWAFVGGLRWSSADGEPLRTTARVRIDALPPQIRLHHDRHQGSP